MIRAIDTKYNGYFFRSRLEARWAVFFDFCNIKYEYEKDGYNLDETYYLPDFWLPELDIFIEVKGKNPDKNEIRKCELLAMKSGKDVIILVGNIPYPNPCKDNTKPHHSYVYFSTGGEDNDLWFCECPQCGHIGIEFDGRSDRLICHEKNGCPRSPHGDKGYNYDSDKLIKAYQNARCHRFKNEY